MKNILLQECIDSLIIKRVFDDANSKVLFDEFSNKIKFTFYGRVDWKVYPRKKKIENNEDVLFYLDKTDICLLFWNEASLPVIETSLNCFLKNIDDVLAVSFDTWILIREKNIIIEFFHDGEITLLDIS